MRRISRWTAVTFAMLVLCAAAYGFGAPGASAAPASTSVVVHIVQGAPQPQTVTIAPGQVVTFENDDPLPHAIYALGVPRSLPILPTQTTDFGPFDVGRYDYRIDALGGAGVILVSTAAADPVPATTAPPTTSAPTTTTAPATTTTTTTSTTTSTTTTTAPTTTAPTTTAPQATIVAEPAAHTTPGGGGVGSTVGLAAGIALVAVGGAVVAFAAIRQS